MNYFIIKTFLKSFRANIYAILKIFGGIFRNVSAFLGFRCSIPFSISSKEASLNKKRVAPLILSLINKMLGWFAYL